MNRVRYRIGKPPGRLFVTGGTAGPVPCNYAGYIGECRERICPFRRYQTLLPVIHRFNSAPVFLWTGTIQNKFRRPSPTRFRARFRMDGNAERVREHGTVKTRSGRSAVPYIIYDNGTFGRTRSK